MRDLADDGSKTAMPQPFLHACKKGFVVTSLRVDDPVAVETRLGDRWGKKVGARDAPENLSLCSGSDASAEHCGGSTIDGFVAATRHLMQRSQR